MWLLSDRLFALLEEAKGSRARIEDIVSAQASRDAAADARVAKALSSVNTIVRENRILTERHTRTIVRQEVRTTVTATTTQTVTRTPASCKRVVVAAVCPTTQGIGAPFAAAIVLMTFGGFLLLRRAAG